MLENLDERATNSLLYSLALGSAGYGHFSAQSVELPLTDKLFIMQCNIIKEAAENGGCVVVGRCGDYILKDNPRCFKVFIHSKLENRAKRIAEKSGIPIEKAWEYCQKTDKKRAGYYNFYAGGKWGVAENYDLCIDSAIGAENAADIIIKAAEIKTALLEK